MTTDRSVREQAMTDWVGAQLSQHLAIPRDQLQYRVSMLAGDASFRRYYRPTPNQSNGVGWIRLPENKTPGPLSPFSRF